MDATEPARACRRSIAGWAHLSGRPPTPSRRARGWGTGCVSVAAPPVAVAPLARPTCAAMCNPCVWPPPRRRRTENIARHAWLNFAVHGAPIAHRTTLCIHVSIVPRGGQIVVAHPSATGPSPPRRGDQIGGRPPIKSRPRGKLNRAHGEGESHPLRKSIAPAEMNRGRGKNASRPRKNTPRPRRK